MRRTVIYKLSVKRVKKMGKEESEERRKGKKQQNVKLVTIFGITLKKQIGT